MEFLCTIYLEVGARTNYILCYVLVNFREHYIYPTPSTCGNQCGNNSQNESNPNPLKISNQIFF